MIDLILETSLGDIRLALYQDGKCLWKHTEIRGRGEVLDSLLDIGLQEISQSLSAISRILVTVGPGSFTGLRTGLAFVQGLCFLGNRKLYSISTLKALSMCHPGSTVLIEARKNLWYMGRGPGDSLMEEEKVVGLDIVNAIQEPIVGDSSVPVSMVSEWPTDFDLDLLLPLFSVLPEIVKNEDLAPNYIQKPAVTASKA